MNYYERTDCRFCHSRDLVTYLDLGDQPPSNSFIKCEQISTEKKFPLKVSLCTQCGLSQLLGVVSAADIFDDYQYISSTSKALVKHYEGMVAELKGRFNLGSRDRVVDIGCNDGVLLNAYGDDVPNTIGVEPSKVGELAKDAGHTVYSSFFTLATAEKVKRQSGTAKIITATNVFAHIDDIHTVVEGVDHLLTEDGVFIIEAPYILDMIEQNYFDTIYHEHLCYLGVLSLSKLMHMHGLEVFDVKRISLGASGPAIRVFCQRLGGRHRVQQSVSELIALEESWKIRSPQPYMEFADRLYTIKEDLHQILWKLKRDGARIGAYGAPAKGNTLLNTFCLGTDLITEGVAETNPIKIGKLTPGTHLPIVSEKLFINRRPDYALLLTWNYLDFFLKKSDYIKNGGKFIVPLPSPSVRPNSL